MNTLSLKKIINDGNKVLYEYNVDGEWQKYFSDEAFCVEYDQCVKDVDESILAIPFVASIIMVAWLFDGEIRINSLDKSFYNCLDDVKKGFEKIHPKATFKGNVKVKKLVDNKYCEGERVLSLFSGGVDAVNTLTRIFDKKPLLVTLWGADVSVNDIVSWENVKEQIEIYAKNYQLNNTYVKTNFRTFVNESLLHCFVMNNYNAGWYLGFEHNLGIIGCLAPICCINGISEVYIASSFTINERGIIPCASDPRTDASIKFSDTQIIHDGFKFNRQDKIAQICDYKKKHLNSINVRVCWKSDDGYNCCNCEKCFRTMAGILIEGENPVDYGFYNINNAAKRIKKFINYKYALNDEDGTTAEWNYIVERAKKIDCPEDMKWIKSFKPDKTFINRLKKIKEIIKRGNR